MNDPRFMTDWQVGKEAGGRRSDSIGGDEAARTVVDVERLRSAGYLETS